MSGCPPPTKGAECRDIVVVVKVVVVIVLVMIVMIVEIPITYREPLAIARVCANAHVSIIIISSSNNVINVSNDSRDTYYISGETYPSTRISTVRLKTEMC